MPSTTNPIRNDLAYDVIFLNYRESPGIAEVVGANSPDKWDEQQGYGLSGATLRYAGAGLTSFKVKLRLFEEEHFEAWDSWKNILGTARKNRTPKQKALFIYHPFLAEKGISEVVVEDWIQPTQVEPGVWEVEISLKQYRRPVLQFGKADGTVGKDQTTEDSLDRKIKDELATANDLAPKAGF
jgi:hypothetical protein